jgi:hypothetical protein
MSTQPACWLHAVVQAVLLSVTYRSFHPSFQPSLTNPPPPLVSLPFLTFCCAVELLATAASGQHLSSAQLSLQAANMRGSYFARFTAIMAMLATSAAVSEAVPLFEQWCPEHNISDVPKFLKHWYHERYEKREDDEDFLRDAARSGRPPHITRDEALEAAAEFKKGWHSNGTWKPFATIKQVRVQLMWRQRGAPGIRHARFTPSILGCCKINSDLLQAFQKRTHLKELLAAKADRGVTMEYIFTRAQLADPTLVIKKAVLRPEFTTQEQEQRCEFALKMLNEPPEWLKGIVFMDESSVPVDPQPQTYIGERGKEYVKTDKRKRKHPLQIPRLHYELAVCYATGLLSLDILSFTSGYDDPVQYYVSGCAAASGCEPMPHPALLTSSTSQRSMHL